MRLPTLWNRFNSKTSVENSEIGVNGSVHASSPVTFSAGVFGNAMYHPYTIGGAGQDVSFINTPLAEEGAIEFWVKPDGYSVNDASTSDGNRHRVINRQVDPQIQIEFHESRGIYVTFKPGASQSYFWGGGVIPDGEWHHFAFVWDNSTVKGYLDNKELDYNTNVHNGNMQDCTIDDMTIGIRTGDTSNGLDGYIDNLKIWDYPKRVYGRDRFIEGTSIPLIRS